MNFIIEKFKKVSVHIWEEQILPVFRSAFFDKQFASLPLAGPMFNLWEHFFKLGKIPFFREHLPEFDPKLTDMRWIPINQKIEGAEEIALPEDVLFKLIEKAKHRVIVNFCGCRTACGCQHYPNDIGCLMMGESALLIPEKSRREVNIQEAKEHVVKAIATGLIPIAGKARIDNDLFMLPDKNKLLTICFCCECCCITRFTRHVPLDVLDSMIRPIEGLRIEVTDKCIGCGKCVDKCYTQAITIVDNRAVINETCRVCGRCAMNCPAKAIKLTLANPSASQEIIQRIESIVEF